MKRLLITGSRNGCDERKLREELIRAYYELVGWDTQSDDIVILVHGGAPGVDSQAEQIWKSWRLPVEIHPADWSIGKKAGPIRNQEMVDSGADLCLGFPSADSTGTFDCLRRAEAAAIPVKTFLPETTEEQR